MTAEKVQKLIYWGDEELEQYALDGAEKAYADALKIARSSGRGVELALDGLMRLAAKCIALGYPSKPVTLHWYFEEAGSLQLSRDFRALSALRERQGDLKAAELLLVRSLELKLEALGPADEETLEVLQDAALLLQTQGRSAESLYALAFAKKAGQSERPEKDGKSESAGQHAPDAVPAAMKEDPAAEGSAETGPKGGSTSPAPRERADQVSKSPSSTPASRSESLSVPPPGASNPTQSESVRVEKSSDDSSKSKPKPNQAGKNTRKNAADAADSNRESAAPPVQSAKPEPAKTEAEPAKAEPAKAESAKAESAKAEPVKAEPAVEPEPVASPPPRRPFVERPVDPSEDEASLWEAVTPKEAFDDIGAQLDKAFKQIQVQPGGDESEPFEGSIQHRYRTGELKKPDLSELKKNAVQNDEPGAWFNDDKLDLPVSSRQPTASSPVPAAAQDVSANLADALTSAPQSLFMSTLPSEAVNTFVETGFASISSTPGYVEVLPAGADEGFGTQGANSALISAPGEAPAEATTTAADSNVLNSAAGTSGAVAASESWSAEPSDVSATVFEPPPHGPLLQPNRAADAHLIDDRLTVSNSVGELATNPSVCEVPSDFGDSADSRLLEPDTTEGVELGNGGLDSNLLFTAVESDLPFVPDGSLLENSLPQPVAAVSDGLEFGVPLEGNLLHESVTAFSNHQGGNAPVAPIADVSSSPSEPSYPTDQEPSVSNTVPSAMASLDSNVAAAASESVFVAPPVPELVKGDALASQGDHQGRPGATESVPTFDGGLDDSTVWDELERIERQKAGRTVQSTSVEPPVGDTSSSKSEPNDGPAEPPSNAEPWYAEHTGDAANIHVPVSFDDKSGHDLLKESEESELEQGAESRLAESSTPLSSTSAPITQLPTLPSSTKVTADASEPSPSQPQAATADDAAGRSSAAADPAGTPPPEYYRGRKHAVVPAITPESKPKIRAAKRAKDKNTSARQAEAASENPRPADVIEDSSTAEAHRQDGVSDTEQLSVLKEGAPTDMVQGETARAAADAASVCDTEKSFEQPLTALELQSDAFADPTASSAADIKSELTSAPDAGGDPAADSVSATAGDLNVQPAGAEEARPSALDSGSASISWKELGDLVEAQSSGTSGAADGLAASSTEAAHTGGDPGALAVDGTEISNHVQLDLNHDSAEDDGTREAWLQYLTFVQERVGPCVEDDEVQRLSEIQQVISLSLERARDQVAWNESTLEPHETVKSIDWKILDDLALLYRLIAGTNAAAYELSLMYALAVRISKLGPNHHDTLQTLQRLDRLYNLIGLTEASGFVAPILKAPVGMSPLKANSPGADDDANVEGATPEDNGASPCSADHDGGSSEPPEPVMRRSRYLTAGNEKTGAYEYMKRAQVDPDLDDFLALADQGSAADAGGGEPRSRRLPRRDAPAYQPPVFVPAQVEGLMSDASAQLRINLASSVLFELQHNPAAEGAADKLAQVRQTLAQVPPAEALPYVRNLLEIAQRLLGEDHLETISCCFLAGLVNKGAEIPQLERCFETAFAKRLKLLGPLNPDTAAVAYEYALACKVWDDSEQGRLRTRAVGAFSMSYGLAHSRTMKIIPPTERRLVNLEFDSPPVQGAVVLKSTKQSKVILVVDDHQPRSDAERTDVLMQASAELERNRFMSPDFPRVSESIYEATSLYNKLEDDSRVWELLAPLEHVVLASLLEHQGLKEMDRSNYKEALHIFDTVERVRARVLPPGHPDIALNEMRRGFVLVQMDDLAGAEDLYLQANDVLEPIRDEQLYLHAAVLHNLAALHFRKGALVPAEKLFERAAGQLEKVTDVVPQISVCRENLKRVKNSRSSS